MIGYANSVRSPKVDICTAEIFDKMVDSAAVAVTCAEIADALEKCLRGEISKEDFETMKAELKKQLPVFTPHATFRNGRRKNADAVATGNSIFDLDHIADPEGYYLEHISKRIDELGILLVHITPSTEGLRLVFAIPEEVQVEEGGNRLEAAQKWMAEKLGISNYDQTVKDYARCSFSVPRSYILYINRERLFAEAASEVTDIKTDEDNTAKTLSGEVQSAEVVQESEETRLIDGNPMPAAAEEIKFKDIPYSEIIREWFNLNGGEPVQGERNDKLHKLAVHLRYICDDDAEMLLRIMPRYGLSEFEMRSLVKSAINARRCSLPRILNKAIRNITDRISKESAAAEGAANTSAQEKTNCLSNGMPVEETADEETENQPPQMPKKLPKLIGLLLSRTPEIYQPAVAHAIFPSLAAHLWKTRFKYIDNIDHEATLMCCLMAGTGAGKNCVSEPINRIMADIRKRDEENLEREKKWKEEVQMKGANKDKRQRPEGLVIQEIDSDMTNPAFVMRTAEADGHFLYTNVNEIDQFDSLRGSGKSHQQFQIMCLAFDPGNRYGQTRVSSQSVTEKVTIRFNWNASTTIIKGKSYFRRVLTDGPVSRINFCTIPEREIGAAMPIYGTYDAAFDEQLRPYISNLTNARGLIDCPQAYNLAVKMVKENAEKSLLSQSRVYENLSFRANVIAWLKACVLYVANGNKWEKSIEDFVRWSYEYDMWCKLEFFGEGIESATESASGIAYNLKRGPKSLLDLLPDEFTLHDLELVKGTRSQTAVTEKSLRNILHQWQFRGYIERVEGAEDRYRKTAKKCSDNMAKAIRGEL